MTKPKKYNCSRSFEIVIRGRRTSSERPLIGALGSGSRCCPGVTPDYSGTASSGLFCWYLCISGNRNLYFALDFCYMPSCNAGLLSNRLFVESSGVIFAAGSPGAQTSSWGLSTSFFAPFGRSGHVTHEDNQLNSSSMEKCLPL